MRDDLSRLRESLKTNTSRRGERVRRKKAFELGKELEPKLQEITTQIKEKIKIAGKETPIETEAPAEEAAEAVEGEEEPAEKSKRVAKISVQRYKGLGEMNSEELWETTMDPARRILKQVTINDAQEADQVFDMLMGTDVPARKSFIQSHAKEATLDI